MGRVSDIISKLGNSKGKIAKFSECKNLDEIVEFFQQEDSNITEEEIVDYFALVLDYIISNDIIENLDLDELSKVSGGKMISNDVMKRFSVLALSGMTAFTGVGFHSNIITAKKLEEGTRYRKDFLNNLKSRMNETNKASIDAVKKELGVVKSKDGKWLYKRNDDGNDTITLLKPLKDNCKRLDSIIDGYKITRIEDSFSFMKRAIKRRISAENPRGDDGIVILLTNIFYPIIRLFDLHFKYSNVDTYPDLEYINLEYCKHIGKDAFRHCDNLKEINIDTIDSMGSGVFSDCQNLKKVTISGNVKTIGEGAFKGCKNLEELTIHEGVKEIGKEAFKDCEKLKKVVIPSSVKTIGESAFETYELDGNYRITRNGMLNEVIMSDGVGNIGKHAFRNCKIKKLLIPKSVKTIGEGAFDICTELEDLELENGIKSIENSAFRRCQKLKKVVIPASVKIIGNDAFNTCSLEDVIISDGVKQIGVNAFKCCNVRSLLIPKSVKIIGESAFENCSKLEELILENGIENIGNRAFERCSKLKKVIIPGSVKMIGDNAFNTAFYGRIWDNKKRVYFDACTEKGLLEEIVISDGVESIGENAFKNCNIKKLIIPRSVKVIGNFAFEGCSELKKLVISDGITSIGAHAFEGCEKLMEIKFPEIVDYVGDEAFKNCKSLSQVTLCYKNKGKDIFSGCCNLENLSAVQAI